MSRTNLAATLLAVWAISTPALVQADGIDSVRVFPTSAITPDDNVVLQVFYKAPTGPLTLAAPVTVNVDGGEVVAEVFVNVESTRSYEYLLVNIDLGRLPVGEFRYVVHVRTPQGDTSASGWLQVVAPGSGPETERGMLYWAEYHFGSLLRSTADGIRVESLPVATLVRTQRMVVSGAQQSVFWAEGLTMYRANLRGRGVENLMADVRGSFALDHADQFIYWADGPAIKRARFDGSGVETIATEGDWAYDPAWDPVGKYLYWRVYRHLGPAQPDHYEFVRIAVGQTEVQTVVRGTYYSSPGFVRDPLGGHLYWIERSEETDRSFILRNHGGHEILVSNEGYPEKLTLVPEEGKMYWAEWLFFPDSGMRIMRASLDGSDVEIVVDETDFGEGYVHDLIIDTASGKVYWALVPKRFGPDSRNPLLDGRIQRANLDGTNVEDVVTGLGRPLAMQFLREFIRDDAPALSDCLDGPHKQFGTACRWFDSDHDMDVDLRDVAMLVNTLTE